MRSAQKRRRKGLPAPFFSGFVGGRGLDSGGGAAVKLLEFFVKIGGGAESYPEGDLRYGEAALFQKLSCFLHPDIVQAGKEGDAGGFLKEAAQVVAA